MNREDIIRMAREAGMSFNQSLEELSTPFCDGVHCDELERFAALVAAAEREACLRLVEPNDEHRRDASWGYLGGDEGVALLDGVAAAIRTRGQA